MCLCACLCVSVYAYAYFFKALSDDQRSDDGEIRLKSTFTPTFPHLPPLPIPQQFTSPFPCHQLYSPFSHVTLPSTALPIPFTSLFVSYPNSSIPSNFIHLTHHSPTPLSGSSTLPLVFPTTLVLTLPLPFPLLFLPTFPPKPYHS